VQNSTKLVALLVAFALLTGCADTIEKVKNAGKPPEMTDVIDPTAKLDYEPMSWPLPDAQPPGPVYSNSLWQPGSRAFFRDQRAARVGDILRVNVQIQDKAELDNETERKRDATETLDASPVFGLEDKLFKALPGKANPAALLGTNSSTNTKGTGGIKRQEKIETQVAALVTQVLPNGNLVIEGSQEIRVNYEIREVSVKGVVRPQDINVDNTVNSTQIAQARIVYGGRGQLFDVQQPRYGQQVIEALSPF
jgi:flagellar L-ring protein precursor FlgH